ncbi:hypothetical protein Cob_v005033 [Colletotrichum orbiculare MAFF 240422]|uniref:Secreted protein n=1 Tax=Colletotrichum orbiculare (strain 104-T / ATCC 96160 / CBS 514.97 / LARS 414 / MAFF 240422) TaxID=1213857 RepID=A0A484FVX2_COLOR|nr:hypothetical protein Cob_v005033 [Colletotrichum orbiculare MAFF 240422]
MYNTFSGPLFVLVCLPCTLVFLRLSRGSEIFFRNGPNVALSLKTPNGHIFCAPSSYTLHTLLPHFATPRVLPLSQKK